MTCRHSDHQLKKLAFEPHVPLSPTSLLNSSPHEIRRKLSNNKISHLYKSGPLNANVVPHSHYSQLRPQSSPTACRPLHPTSMCDQILYDGVKLTPQNLRSSQLPTRRSSRNCVPLSALVFRRCSGSGIFGLNSLSVHGLKSDRRRYTYSKLFSGGWMVRTRD
jgi:hypothetical protein